MIKRLTRPNVEADPTISKELDWKGNIHLLGDRTLHLILNGPTVNSVPKGALRCIIRQLYERLKMYEDNSLIPSESGSTNHGHWIVTEDDYTWDEEQGDEIRVILERRCSVCGMSTRRCFRPNFCDICGTQMDMEDTEEVT